MILIFYIGSNCVFGFDEIWLFKINFSKGKL